MLEQKINSDFIQAMKSKDSIKVSTLSLLRAQIKNVIIDQKIDALDDVDVIRIIKKQVKQRQDSIKQYLDGGREDLAKKEEQEFEILKEYLPEDMDKDQIVKIISDAIDDLQAKSMKDMGNVMKIVLSKTAERADGKMVSDLVKQELSKLQEA